MVIIGDSKWSKNSERTGKTYLKTDMEIIGKIELKFI